MSTNSPPKIMSPAELRDYFMTLEEYLDAAKFPTTSQKGLSPLEQLQIDAFNYDQLEEAIANGHQMDEEQGQIRAELQAKRPWMAELTRQIELSLIHI